MKQIVKWVFVSGVLALVCFYGAAKLTIHHIAHAQVRVVPFVLRTDSYNYDNGPKGELFLKEVVARRSDGASAVISTVGDPSSGSTLKTLNFLDGTMVEVYDPIQAKSSWHMAAIRLAGLKERLLNPASDCMPKEKLEGTRKVLGRDVILGHAVIRIEADSSDGRLVDWKAPDLACETVEFTFEERQPDGSLKLKAHERAVSLDIGEPPPDVFDSGANYEEMKPSEAQARYFRKLGIPEDPATKQSAKRSDTIYLQGQR
jgi:hypothetical protein